MDATVKMAAQHAAEHAIQGYKASQNQNQNDLKEVQKELKTPDTKTEAPGTMVKKAVTKAVLKNDNKLAHSKKKVVKASDSAIMNALQGLTMSPTANGLNAATAAGIAIAKSTLEGHGGSAGILGALGKMPKGIK